MMNLAEYVGTEDMPAHLQQRKLSSWAHLKLLRDHLAEGAVREGLPARLAGLVVPLREGRQPYLHTIQSELSHQW